MTVSQRTLRIFPQIRSAHIDDLNRAAPRPTLYFTVYYEAVGRDIPDDWRQTGIVGVLARLWTDPPDSLELYEPAWLLYRWILIAAVFRIRTRGRPATLGFYAIESNPLPQKLAPARIRRIAAPAYRKLLRGCLSRLVDRIVFGTDTAVEAYAGLVSPRVETTVIYDLRQPRSQWATDKRPWSASFVGVLDARKGLPELMAAWPALEARHPDAHLEIIGDGKLHDQTVAWAAQRPGSRTYRGRIPHDDVLRTLAATAVFLLPSQRADGWREQVGLGIIEALSCGCTVVSTDETGIAGWLRARGHHIIPAADTAARLAPAIEAALSGPIPPDQVLASLPEVNGRVSSDAWLHRGAR